MMDTTKVLGNKNRLKVISFTTNPTAIGLKLIPIFQIANIQVFLQTRGNQSSSENPLKTSNAESVMLFWQFINTG
jgi:hypothetical protein